jgi:hypothetical protein
MFQGQAHCSRQPDTPLGLLLTGHTEDHSRELVTVAFTGAAPPDLPETLTNPRVDQLDGGRYQISSASQRWIIPARAVHVHREVAEPFYEAVAPRVAPLKKRVFWRIVLALAAHPLGKRMLLALRR